MNKVKIGALLMGLLLWGGLSAQAQIGEHRNDFSIGFNGGYVLSSVGFEPEVQQKQHGGMTAGLSMKYTCEKYFKTICSICRGQLCQGGMERGYSRHRQSTCHHH